MNRICLALALLFGSTAAFAQSQPPPVVSPEVHPDGSVTFRFRAPNAKEVAVSIEGSAKPLPMQEDAQGIWSVTADRLTPDYYGRSEERRVGKECRPRWSP